MEDLIVKSLANLPAAVVLSTALWIMVKRFMDQSKEDRDLVVKQFDARVASLERRSDACEEDRDRMRDEIFKLAQRQ